MSSQPVQVTWSPLNGPTKRQLSVHEGVWQPAPIAPGQQGRVVVEVLATQKQARDMYTLTRWDAERQRTVMLGEVTFPEP